MGNSSHDIFLAPLDGVVSYLFKGHVLEGHPLLLPPVSANVGVLVPVEPEPGLVQPSVQHHLPGQPAAHYGANRLHRRCRIWVKQERAQVAAISRCHDEGKEEPLQQGQPDTRKD